MKDQLPEMNHLEIRLLYWHILLLIDPDTMLAKAADSFYN